MKPWSVVTTGEVYEIVLDSDSCLTGVDPYYDLHTELHVTHSKTRCAYCGRTNDSSEDLCKSCGAPLKEEA